MSWQQIIGHGAIEHRFRIAAMRNRLASTYLFVGPEGIGKRMFARQFAKSLLCESNSEADLQSCDLCPQCQQVEKGSHPDLIEIAKPKDKNNLPLSLFIGGDDFGLGLCHAIALKPFRGGRKIAIVDDADYLFAESANALLKMLEEPPEKSILILIGTSEHQQLPTIRSRSQIVRFSPLTVDELIAVLRTLPEAAETSSLSETAAAGNGSIKTALQLLEAEICEFRSTVLRQLATLCPGQGDFQKTVVTFAGDKVTDGAQKRERLRFVADITINFFESLAAKLVGRPFSGDTVLRHAIEQASATWRAPLTCLAASIERTYELHQHIDAFVSPANMVDPWLNDLAELAAGARPKLTLRG